MPESKPNHTLEHKFAGTCIKTNEQTKKDKGM
jgi:hypothetical protein